MGLSPGYGHTPTPDDELEYLLPAARELLGEPVTRAAIYDVEQGVQLQVSELHLIGAIDGSLGLDSLLQSGFIRELHRDLYGDLWSWAGRFRRHELNIGVAPEQIAVQLRDALDDIAFRWKHTTDWSAAVLGIAVHAATVRVHPFTDGNGRVTRLLADLVFVAAQEVPRPRVYDWDLDKARYIDLLREYDRHRDPVDLASYVGTVELDQ